MRLPLAVPIMSRDGTLAKGSKLVNVYTEGKEGRVKVRSRPGISTAVNSLVGYGNGLFGSVGLSSATSPSDSGVVYTFVDGTFAKTYATGGLDTASLGSIGISTVINGGVPFFFKGEYYVHQISTFIKRTSLTEGNASSWTVVTSTAPLPHRSYKYPFEFNGKMYLWKPYGETGGGTDPFMTESADGTTWSTMEMSSAVIFYSGNSVDFNNVMVTKSSQQTVWWANAKEGTFSWNSTGIFPPAIATSSRWHQLVAIDPAISTAATGNEQIVTDNTYFYMALENSTYSIPVPYGVTSVAQGYTTTWTVLNANTGFGTTSTQTLGLYKGKFVLITKTSSSEGIWMSEDFVNWKGAAASTLVSNGYFTDEANAMLANSTYVYFFNNYDNAFSSTQTTIGSISNPNNVPIDFMQSE